MANTTNFALDILKCPPSGSIKSIVYPSPTKLCVVQGAETLMCIDLKDFFIPIKDAQRTSFILDGYASAEIPLTQYVNDFCGLGATSGAKFASFFFTYPSGTGSSASEQYVEWTFEREITTGPLATLDPTVIDNSGSTGSISTDSDVYYRINFSPGIVTIDGTKFGFLTEDAKAVITKGGLKLWSENEGTILFNTFNSSIQSNELTCVSYDAAGVLWIGSADAGILSAKWNGGVFSFSNFNSSNSSLLSNSVNDIFVSDNYVAVATSLGISLYNVTGATWSNFSRTNVNIIDDLSFSSVFIDYPYLIAGASSGAYVYDIVNSTWSKYDNSVTGWSSSTNANRIISRENEVFVATNENIVTFTIGATSCTEIGLPLGPTSPWRDISDIKYVSTGETGATGVDFLIASSRLGEIYEYAIPIGPSGATGWTIYSGTAGDLLQSGVNAIVVDGYVYIANDDGFGRLDEDSGVVETLPTAAQTSDVLFSFPGDGAFPVSLTQKIYVGFSKPVDQTVLENHIIFEDLVTGLTLSYSLTSSDGYYYQVVPASSFSYANPYRFRIEQGMTSVDGKYFRQVVDSSFITYDKNPINGWNVAGKQLTLSGADGHYVDSIVFRNPHKFDVSVTALIAI